MTGPGAGSPAISQARRPRSLASRSNSAQSRALRAAPACIRVVSSSRPIPAAMASACPSISATTLSTLSP